MHFPMSAGTLPLKVLPATTKVTRPVSLPRPKGMDPVSPKSEILIPVMRSSPSKIPHCTPSHPHGEEELSDNHCCNLLLAVPFRTVDAQVFRAVWSALSHTSDVEGADCKPIYNKGKIPEQSQKSQVKPSSSQILKKARKKELPEALYV